MIFKTKDLLVTVLPKVPDPHCLLRTLICRYPTFCGHVTCVLGTCGICSVRVSGGGCGFFHSCGPGGSACDPTIFCPGGSRDPFVIQHIEDLVALRADLQETLKQLDTIQKEGLPSSITSRAEAEALEQSLNEALKQVRDAKSKLPRG